MRKKYILYIALSYSTIIFTAQISHTVKGSSPLIPKFKPITLGNITLTNEQLNILSDKDRNDLMKIANPSCLLKCYGLNNQTIQPKDMVVIENIIKRNQQLFKDFAIAKKTKNADECCTEQSISCAYLETCGRCAAVTSLGSCFLGSMIPACTIPMTYAMIALLSSIPVGCATTELCNCLCYRYCTKEKEYEVK